MTKAARVLFFTKMLLVIPVGALLSTLILYLTKKLHFTDSTAIEMVASFIAFGGMARMVGGLIGDRYFSFRFLLCVSAIMLSLGCLLILSPKTLHWGITFAAIGSGLTIAANCLLTELFPNDSHRQTAFLWNYSGMNIGYLISFVLSGYYELSGHYTILFTFCSGIAFLTFIIIVSNYQTLLPVKSKQNIEKNAHQFIFKILFILFFIAIYHLIKQANITHIFISVFWLIITIGIIYYVIKSSSYENKINVFAYFTLLIPVLFFWVIYHLTPMAITLFIERNVDRHLFNSTIPPQAVQLISTMTIVIGGPLLSIMFNKLQTRGIRISAFTQFSIALLLIGLSLMILSIGLYHAGTNNKVNFIWIILSFIVQGLGEILIAPIGFAMIRRYAPSTLRGIMMGHWMMLISIGAIVSSKISTYLFNQFLESTPLILNNLYYDYFYFLGVSTILSGIMMYIAVKHIFRFKIFLQL